MKISFNVDDLSPLFNFDHLDLLHDALDLKFNAFIPTNHFDRALLSDNINWVDQLKQRPWIRPNIHGVKHVSDSGTLEYESLDYNGFMNSFSISLKHFKDVGLDVYGVKAPGWDVRNEQDYFKAIKDIGLKFVNLNYRTQLTPNLNNEYIPSFGYTYCIHEQYEIKDDTILHSHIHPLQGKNGLTNELCVKVINELKNLTIEPCFLDELL